MSDALLYLKMAKPKDIDEYKEWARKELVSNFDDESNAIHFETNSAEAFLRVGQSDFFNNLGQKLVEWNEEYKAVKNGDLLMTKEPPVIHRKSYVSAINKSFRTDILWNDKYPDPPKKGWVKADAVFQSLNDGLRGTIVCRFIDGPIFLIERLRKYASDLGYSFNSYSQERDAGYYAFHSYITIPVQLTDKKWERESVNVSIELQITTQLQDVLKEMTHHFYEVDRLEPPDGSGWKWEFGTNRFKIGYLSHALHLLESIIVEARDSDGQQAAGEKK